MSTSAAIWARRSARALASTSATRQKLKRRQSATVQATMRKADHECAVFPGVPEMLRRLKEAGLVLCTATSKPTRVVTPILEEQGLAEYFDFIGGASMDESRDTKTAVVRYVLAQPMMQGKRVLMVGDRNDDMRGAADCGLDAAGALYGYGSREELEPFHPVILARDCADLADQILHMAE